MKKNVLILSASPRKGGNSDTICDAFMQGVQEANHQVEKIFLGDQKIEYCKACYQCTKLGRCFQKDDVEQIIDQMLEADVIVMASPIYFYNFCGQLKTLIDRTVSRYTQIQNKEIYFIGTCWDSRKEALDTAIAGVQGFVDCIGNSKIEGIIYGTSLDGPNDAKQSHKLEQAYEMGKQV